MESCYVQQDRGRSGIYLGKGLSQKISGFYTKNNFSSIRGEKMIEKKTIDTLGLSVLAHNTLKRSGIDTLDELLEVIESDNLRKVRGLSKKNSKRNCPKGILQKL